MSNGILEYYVEIDGTKVTMTLVADSVEAANKLAETLDAKLRSGTVNGIEPIKSVEAPDERGP